MSFYALMGFTNKCNHCGNVCHNQYRLCATCQKNQVPDLGLEKLIIYETRCRVSGMKYKSGHKPDPHGYFETAIVSGTPSQRKRKKTLGLKGKCRSNLITPHDRSSQEHEEDFGCPRSQCSFHGDNMREDS